MDDQEIQVRRRHLPHWTLNGATYFVTFRLRSKELSVQEQEVALATIKNGNGRYYRLIAALVMPDHVHLLLTSLLAVNTI